MNFQRGRDHEEPEINLIPMIDVLLVIIIFLMVTTTYEKFSALKINLPQASGEQSAVSPVKINVSVDAIEHYAINDAGVVFGGVGKFSQALRRAAGDQKNPMIIINADAKTPHQAVINIMEAARQAGFNSITFTTSRK
ncbi:MAG: biopolymer transporter ExbD [Candidatus Nitrotoga sp.]